MLRRRPGEKDQIPFNMLNEVTIVDTASFRFWGEGEGEGWLCVYRVLAHPAFLIQGLRFWGSTRVLASQEVSTYNNVDKVRGWSSHF